MISMLRKPLLAAFVLLLRRRRYSRRPAKDPPRSFSLSTTRTFAPGESVKIQLLAHNVPELEFRVYKVRDAEKFFAGLKDPHSFGIESYSPQEQIDQRTLSSGCTTSRRTSGISSGTSSAASLLTRRATASAKNRASWASAAR